MKTQLLKALVFHILLAEQYLHALRDMPVNADVGVVLHHAALVGGVIIASAFI